MPVGQSRINERIVPGLALVLTVVDDSPVVAGASIVEPWKRGRSLGVMFIAGAMAAGDIITIGLQKRRRGTSTWDTVYKSDGVTALTVAEADGGSLESGFIFGELDLEQLHVSDEDPYNPKVSGVRYDYDAIRFTAVNAVAQNVSVSGVYWIDDLHTRPPAEAANVKFIADQVTNNG